MTTPRFLPGFRWTCRITGALYVLLAGSILARGAAVAMAPFGVPDVVLHAPHYADAIFWVYSHQLVLGLLLLVLGQVVEEPRAQRAIARALLGAQLYFVGLDVRSSDTALGDGLYQGPASIMPAV